MQICICINIYTLRALDYKAGTHILSLCHLKKSIINKYVYNNIIVFIMSSIGNNAVAQKRDSNANWQKWKLEQVGSDACNIVSTYCPSNCLQIAGKTSQLQTIAWSDGIHKAIAIQSNQLRCRYNALSWKDRHEIGLQVTVMEACSLSV